MELQKNMKGVADYKRQQKLEMLKFTCLNCASRIYSNSNSAINAKYVVDFAVDLYNEVIKRDYLPLKKGDEDEGVNNCKG